MQTKLLSIKFTQVISIFTLILITLMCISSDIAISEDTNPSAESESTKDISEDDFVELEKDMDLIELIETISKINNETYILDESVKPQKVNIITPEGGMKKEDFIKFFDVILNLNGLSVVKTGDINKVLSSNRIKEESTPTIIELNN